jgi:hypothetical protein
VAHAIYRITRASLNQMASNTVGMIHGLIFRPMEGLAGIVLGVPGFANHRHIG